jgi:hypothetical protein
MVDLMPRRDHNWSKSQAPPNGRLETKRSPDAAGGFQTQGLFRAEEPADAPGQAAEGFGIQFILTAEGVDDVDLGVPGLGVPLVVGELDVADDGAVLVLAGDRPDVHT